MPAPNPATQPTRHYNQPNMPEGTLTTPPSQAHRCPECGHHAAAKQPLPTTFWKDPTRWIPAAFLTLLIAFQFATPLILPFGTFTSRVSNTRGGSLGPDNCTAFPLTRDELARAAAEPGVERARIRSILDHLVSLQNDWHWGSQDPSAHMVVDYWWDQPATRRSFFRPALAIGYPIRWATVGDADSVLLQDYWSIELLMVSLPGPAGQQSTRLLSATPTELLGLFLAVSLVVWLVIKCLRPVRVGVRRQGLRRWWPALACGISMVLAAIPVPSTPSSKRAAESQPEYFPKYMVSITGITNSGVTLHKATEIAQSPDAETVFANTLNAAFERADRGPYKGRVIPKDASIVIGFQSTANTSQTHISVGWPARFLTLKVWPKPAPVGVPPREGQTVWVARYWRNISVALNAGAWPGTSYTGLLYPLHFLVNLVGVMALWYLLRALLRTNLFFRTRKRLAKGQCTNCGYDLKGLRAIAPTT